MISYIMMRFRHVSELPSRSQLKHNHAICSSCVPAGHGLQCYKCDIGIFSLCATSKEDCAAGEQCYSGVGKAGKRPSEVTTPGERGCGEVDVTVAACDGAIHHTSLSFIL